MNEDLQRLQSRLVGRLKDWAPKYSDAVKYMAVPLRVRDLRDQLRSTLIQCGFADPQIDDPARKVTANKVMPIAPPLSGNRRTELTLCWEPMAGEEEVTGIAWLALDKSPGSGGRPDRQATDEVGRLLEANIRRIREGAVRPETAPPHSPVVGPGEAVPELYTGTLRDYSEFASDAEVADLAEGVLPLGSWAFDGCPAGPKLFMKADSTGPEGQQRPREYRGTLVCAPQNSGKTSLIIRWAEAANRAGHNLFLIDVKGSLRRKLRDRLKGCVYYFSTDPDEECERINFLSGLDPMTARGSEAIREVVAALLPSEGWVDRGGKDEFHHRNDVVWLTALIHLLKLREIYVPDHFTDDAGNPREVDLNDLYELIADEMKLCECIEVLRTAEGILRQEKADLPACGVDHWVRELLLLLHPSTSPPRFCLSEGALAELQDDQAAERFRPLAGQLFDSSGLLLRALWEAFEPGAAQSENEESDAPFPEPFLRLADRLLELARLPGEGDREANYGFRAYTQRMVVALEPFARHGTLYAKVRSVGEGSQFSLEELGRDDEQVTIIIAAREQDLEKANTVLALTVTRLRHLLFERMKYSDTSLKPVLLLLDETRRIRTFEANKYITFAREAQAGCVVVYQALDQIGDDRKIAEVLENVGTQIYLGGLVGNTARYFIQTLPKRHRKTVSEQESLSAQGIRARTLVVGKDMGDYVTTAELYTLPAGRWPALVYFNDLPRRKLFLVNMTEGAAPGRSTPQA